MKFAPTLFILSAPWLVIAQNEKPLPVTDSLVVAKCGSCHTVSADGAMQRVSWERATPEGWQELLKRMIREQGVSMSAAEARLMVKYLSDNHGLAPEESKPTLYYAERRLHDEAADAKSDTQGTFIEVCGKCHQAARPLCWRRSADDWKQFTTEHAAHYKFKADDAILAYLSQAAPLTTPEWTAWRAQTQTPDPAGRWLVTAHLAGRGTYTGTMTIGATHNPGEFVTYANLQSVNDGSPLVRTGRNAVFAGSAWRGRSQGPADEGKPAAGAQPDDPSSEAREVMLMSADGSRFEGRWFWGQYQEFGFDVTMRRAGPNATLLTIDPPALQTGSKGNRVRLIGDHFPAQVTAADVTVGAGMTVSRIISSTLTEVIAEVNVAADATPGRRDMAFQSSKLPASVAIYDRVDYIKVIPESSMGAFGSNAYKPGFQHYEAIGYQRGPDGKPHTADDLELGPVAVSWSMDVFYDVDGSKRAIVGQVSPTGFFTPAADPGNNYDVWIVATAKSLKNLEGKPLVGKGYLVVTVPTYTFNGRKYVRELDRWIEEGSSTR